jgi:hypothetical protein
MYLIQYEYFSSFNKANFRKDNTSYHKIFIFSKKINDK